MTTKPVPVELTDLKPCPFCGSKKVSIDTRYANAPDKGYACTCLEDGCHGNIYIVDARYPTPEDAIQAWNRRAAAPQEDELVRECLFVPYVNLEELQWATECGVFFFFTMDDVRDGIHFCPNCGGKVRIKERSDG